MYYDHDEAERALAGLPPERGASGEDGEAAWDCVSPSYEPSLLDGKSSSSLQLCGQSECVRSLSSCLFCRVSFKFVSSLGVGGGFSDHFPFSLRAREEAVPMHVQQFMEHWAGVRAEDRLVRHPVTASCLPLRNLWLEHRTSWRFHRATAQIQDYAVLQMGSCSVLRVAGLTNTLLIGAFFTKE